MTLVDPDVFAADNIFRHVLGTESVGKEKAAALRDYLKTVVPGLNAEAHTERIERLVRSGKISLAEFDAVVSATGNHTVNLFLNDELLRTRAGVNAFFAWNEPLDLGCHAAFVPGCNYLIDGRATFDDLFSRSGGEKYDMTSFCERGQRVERRHFGCGGSYVPYVAEVSIRSALLLVGLVRKATFGLLDDGVVVSEKGDGYWFEKSGFRASSVYEAQRDIRAIKSISSFMG